MAPTKAIGSIVALMTRVLGSVFGDKSWSTWLAVLKAAFGLDLTDIEWATVCELTGRTTLPTRPVRELWLIVGRRSGKSIIAALVAVYATCCRTYTLAPGEVGVFMVVAADRRQARVVKRYIAGLLRAAAVLTPLLARETKEAIVLTNGLQIEIHTCSYRVLRGYTCVGAVVDEVAFWQDDESANPDREVLIALRAAMSSVPEAMLIALTSPYARRGEVWRMYEKHFGNDASDALLVVNAATQRMNPTIEPELIAAAYEDDPIAAATEFGGEFRRDIEAFLSREAIAAVVVPDRHELPPEWGARYAAFVDPSGGSGGDSFTLAIGHQRDEVGILDLVREQRPPFSPEATVAEFAQTLRCYGVQQVVGDRYAGEWPREQFRKHGINYVVSAKTKSDIYRDFLPVVNSCRVELLDLPRLVGQLAGLERRTARGGKDSIDHAPGPNAHDDVANCAAGAVTLLTKKPRQVVGAMRCDWLI